MTTEYNMAFDVGGAAKYLGCSEQAVRLWLKQKKLRGFRAGRLIRITQTALDEYIERNSFGHSTNTDN